MLVWVDYEGQAVRVRGSMMVWEGRQTGPVFGDVGIGGYDMPPCDHLGDVDAAIECRVYH